MQERSFFKRQGDLIIYLSEPYQKKNVLCVDAYVGKELAENIESEESGLEATISDKLPITAKHIQGFNQGDTRTCEFILGTLREEIMNWANKRVTEPKKAECDNRVFEVKV